jgi:hypothetical protein
MIRRNLIGWGALALLIGGCGSAQDTATGSFASGMARGAAPDGTFYAAPADGSGKSLATRWPIVLSHAFSVTAEQSFQGDAAASGGNEVYGVKKMLEAGGAVVYQPNKIAYGSSETRGQLLYKKCAGTTLDEILCKGSNPVEIDGIHLATQRYCADPTLRARNGFADDGECRKKLQFNIICHSQGCLDSRYMLAAVRNEYSGELMYKHAVSWSSMAGANKGTAQADYYLQVLAACLFPGCKSPLIDLAYAVDSLRQNQALVVNGSESAVALTRKYVLQTTDMNCDPSASTTCAPSFNQLYPLPVDPGHPVFYQTFTSQVFDIDHPCYTSKKSNWQIVMDNEGPNDGNISVDSQKFTTYGWGPAGPATPVLPRWVNGTTLDPSRPHPGLEHMAYSDLKVPGMDDGRMSCNGEDNSMFRFSRVSLYRDIVAELAQRGF